MFLWTVLLIVLMAAIAYVAGRTRASGLLVTNGPRLHSLPSYHGLFVAAGAMIGGLALAIAAALAFGAQSFLTPIAAVIGGAVGAAPLYARSSLDFRARNAFERVVLVLLIACSGVSC